MSHVKVEKKVKESRCIKEKGLLNKQRKRTIFKRNCLVLFVPQFYCFYSNVHT